MTSLLLSIAAAVCFPIITANFHVMENDEIDYMDRPDDGPYNNGDALERNELEVLNVIDEDDEHFGNEPVEKHAIIQLTQSGNDLTYEENLDNGEEDTQIVRKKF